MLCVGSILKCFPMRIAMELDKYFKIETDLFDSLEEIRIRLNRPIILKIGQTEKIIEHIVTRDEMTETMQHICENSIYSYQNQICNGYITIKGGHRIGLTGSVVMKENCITNINYISSLNFRIARQILGCSKEILHAILNIRENSVYNTLLASAPGVGKTTLLRDIVRNISNGMEEVCYQGIPISLIDERGEIAGMYKGIPQNDVGIRTDILDDVPKAIGMKMAIRSMSPKVIVADEIGSIEDAEAIKYAVCCGIKGIFTAHGAKVDELMVNPALKDLIESKIFERVIVLEKREETKLQKKIYTLDWEEQKYKIV